MAMSHILQTPSDIMAKLTSHLDIRALKNFRQTCRWAEQESFYEFATRGYKVLTVRCDGTNMSRLLRALDGSPPLARAVDTLAVLFGFGKYESKNPEVAAKAVLGEGSKKTESDGEPTFTDIAELLPNLRELGLRNLTSKDFVYHMAPSHLSSGHSCHAAEVTSVASFWPKITRLRILHSKLEQSQLTTMIRLVSPTLRELQLIGISFTDDGGKKHKLVGLLRDLLPALAYARLVHLVSTSSCGVLSYACFQSIWVESKGPAGVEVAHSGCHSAFADMKGTQAVKVGLDLVWKDMVASDH